MANEYIADGIYRVSGLETTLKNGSWVSDAGTYLVTGQAKLADIPEANPGDVAFTAGYTHIWQLDTDGTTWVELPKTSAFTAATAAAASATEAAESAATATAVKNSIPQSYTDLSNDVVDLRSAIDYKDLTYVGGYALGKISQRTGNNNQSTTRVRTNTFLDNAVDATIEISNAIQLQIFEYTANGTFHNYYVNVTSASTRISHNAITVDNGVIKIAKSNDYKYRLDFYSNPTETTITNAATFAAENIQIINDVTNISNRLDQAVYYNEYVVQTGWSEKGYMKTDGTYNTTNTSYQWIKKPVSEGVAIQFSSKNQGTVASLIYLYDDSVVSYEYYNTGVYYDGVLKTIPSGVDAVVINTLIDATQPGELKISENSKLVSEGVEELFEKVTEIDGKEEPFEGLTFNCLGDSFTQPATAWHSYVHSMLGCEIVNCGVASSAITKDNNTGGSTVLSFYNRLNTLDLTADGTIIFGGINDSLLLQSGDIASLGNINSAHDDTTFYGGVMRLLDAVESSAYMQGKLIIGVIPPDFNATAKEFLPSVQEALREIYSAYSIPFVDLKKDCQEMFLWYPNGSVCEYNRDTYRKGSSNSHPSDAGQKAIAKCIIERGIKMVFPRIAPLPC